MKNKNFNIFNINSIYPIKLNYTELKLFCEKNNLILDNILRTLPNYPNKKRRNKTYKGYYIREVDYIKETNVKNNLNFDKKEIDYINNRITAEKIIHLNIEEIKETDILKEFNLNVREWKIEKLNYSLWDSPNKEEGSVPLYSVKCFFKKREDSEFEINEMKKIIDDIIGNEFNKDIPINVNEDRTMLINIADLHLNKYSKDYNNEIALERYNQAINYFISNKDSNNCILVVGEDYFNIDTINKTTTKGTPQDTETDIYKMFELGLRNLITQIDKLSENFDNVKIILIQGNHDKLLSYLLVKAIDQRTFEKNNVSIDSQVSNRKYITVGNSLIGLGHLDTENKKQKQFLMQNEEKELYGKSKYNYFISGHLHNYSVEEIGGVQYIRLPSLSGTDNWHNEMGFVTSIKGAIAFEFDTDKGLVNKIIFNL